SVTANSNLRVSLTNGAVKVGVKLAGSLNVTAVPPVCTQATVSSPACASAALPCKVTSVPALTFCRAPASAVGGCRQTPSSATALLNTGAAAPVTVISSTIQPTSPTAA